MAAPIYTAPANSFTIEPIFEDWALYDEGCLDMQKMIATQKIFKELQIYFVV